MSNQEPDRRLVASVTVVLPGPKRIVIKPTQTIPVDHVSEQWIELALADGLIYWQDSVPRLSDVKALRPEDGVEVSAVVKAGSEDNPLDDGIALVPGTGDPALDAQLQDIVAKQQAEGIENDGAEIIDQKQVEVNAETGEVTETGGEPDLDDVADAQVS